VKITTPNNWLGLNGITCVVNGAASGIGAAIARALAEQGAHLALLDCNLTGCEALCQSLALQENQQVLCIDCDIADEAAVKSAAEQVQAQLGDCQALVNAAGILRPARLDEITLADWNALLVVNLNGYLLCAREFGRAMRRNQQGSLLHISSIAAQHVHPFSGAYSAGKAAVSSLSKQLAVEWGVDGIRSNCIAPGLTLTAMTADYYQHPGVKEARESFTAVGRIGLPEDIANAALFLLSERASYISGAELEVNGGLSCMLMGKIPRPGFAQAGR